MVVIDLGLEYLKVCSQVQDRWSGSYGQCFSRDMSQEEENEKPD